MKELVVLGFDSRELAEEARPLGAELDREGVPARPPVLRTTLEPAAEERLLAAFTDTAPQGRRP